jgi:hypothetical protein
MALLRSFVGAVEPAVADLDAISCWLVLVWASGDTQAFTDWLRQLHG